MSFTITMRKRCAMEAFQEWLNKKSPGFVVVDVRTSDLCHIDLVVEDNRKEETNQAAESMND